MKADHGDRSLPSALDSLALIEERMDGRVPAFFLDFDGTLAPIVARPELATLPPATKDLLDVLSRRYLVCVLSGRALTDIRQKVGLPRLYFGADHGRHLVGPEGSAVENEVGAEARADLRSAARELRRLLADVQGVIVEEKDLSLSVHYRLTPETQRPAVEETVHLVGSRFPRLQRAGGKLVHELRPGDGWNKGRALLWLLDDLDLGLGQACPLCIGDDLTDEDMFRMVGDQGVSIVVGALDRPTEARFALSGPEEVARFLAFFVR